PVPRAGGPLIVAGDAIVRMGPRNVPPPLGRERRVGVRFAMVRTSTMRGLGTPYFPPPPGEGRVGAADGFAGGAAPRTAAAATGLGTACAARAIDSTTSDSPLSRTVPSPLSRR